jgi:hypothetical protein
MPVKEGLHTRPPQANEIEVTLCHNCNSSDQIHIMNKSITTKPVRCCSLEAGLAVTAT